MMSALSTPSQPEQNNTDSVRPQPIQEVRHFVSENVVNPRYFVPEVMTFSPRSTMVEAACSLNLITGSYK